MYKSFRSFPVALFSSVMGYAATTIVIKNLEVLYDRAQYMSTFFIIFTCILFIFNSFVLIYRLFRFREEVKNEFNHPIQVNFFATISISLLLLSVLFLDVWESFSFTIWIFGAVLQLNLTLMILTKLMWNSSLEKISFAPVSFIPIVGNLVVPIAGSFHVAAEMNWFFFGIGIFFSIVYMTMFINRMFFTESLPDMLIPTLFILLAPPSIGLIAYINMNGGLNQFAYILYSIALFIGLLLLIQLRKILKVPFFISWWSLLFPTAAFTIATIRMFAETGKFYFEWLFWIQLIVLLVLIIYLTLKTTSTLRQPAK